MVIEGRRQKPFSPKLPAEVTLFLLVSWDGAVLAKDFEAQFGIGSRTVYRYAEDIGHCGYAPRIRLLGREYTTGGERLEREGVLRSSSAHIRRLNRLLEILELFREEYESVLFPDGRYEDPAEDLTEGPLAPAVSAPAALAKLRQLHPEEPITLRTIQRDLSLIAAALEHYRGVYML